MRFTNFGMLALLSAIAIAYEAFPYEAVHELTPLKVTIYNDVDSCDAGDNTMYRIIEGAAAGGNGPDVGTCYTFDDDMPGTICAQFTRGGWEGPNGPGCTGPGRSQNDGCITASEEGWDRFRSFRCDWDGSVDVLGNVGCQLDKMTKSPSPAAEKSSPREAVAVKEPSPPIQTADPANDQMAPLEAEVLVDDDSTDDELSTASLRSSIREYNMINEYYLPSDEHESERLDLQNHQLLLTFGGKRYFAPNAETAKRVLDVGTGTGIWAVEFADEHPHAEVIGVDIAAIQPTFVPPNCTFEIDDAEKEWTWSQKFDYIFVRLMVGSLADWDKFTRKCFENLEPGGWLEVIDPTFPASSDDGTLKPNSPLNRWDELTSKGAANLGRPFDEGVNHEKRLKEQGFVNVTRKSFKWPINTWPKDPKYKEIGLWTLANIERNLESISTILLAHGLGMSQEEILVFISEVRAEMRNPRVHAYWEVFVVTGQKPE
ncbi:hypothetical protein NM208_g3155 [Fusarium decemcellulare]|uniref:Uncharacterized protein n=1 Tax=Fusarium decemcellulare TaxID=57161 RepID=A0ACC1SQD0_9HYPO|nr:hypothetical protein NM208_g3155 [Fusarium decemcellulare]